MEDKNKLKKDIDRDRIALLLKIGIIGAFIILVGDLLMGWGIKDIDHTGIERHISQYLKVSDSRMFWSSIFGLIGVPFAVVGHFGIYKLLKPYSQKYAKLYAIGNLGFLTFGGAGVHVSSIESAFFYKYMTAADPNAAFASSVKFASYFLLPLYIVLLTCWLIMVYAHIKAISGGFSPYPRWFVVFSMPVGTLIVSFISILGNHEILNSLMVGAFSLGNIWTLGGHLMMLGKAKERQKKEYILKKKNAEIRICGGDFLRAYENKEELKTEINKTFEKYISEFDNIPEALKDKRVDEVDRTPAENLAYQVGWTTLVLKWEEDEKNGLEVNTPSDKFKWNQLGELYQWFTDTYAHLSLQELKAKLNENIISIYAMIDLLSEEELFKPHMRRWADEATKTAVWEVYKFIHVNTVAPFGTFRTKIRKWKKIAL